MPDMSALKLLPASSFALDTLAAAFNAGYEGYFVPIHMTPEALRRHIDAYDIALDRSLVAVGSDDALHGIALLGVRGMRGWIGGVGVAPAWRERGWGAALMRGVIEQAHLLGLSTLQLEVLEQNSVARQLYVRLGFTTTRRLDVFVGSPSRDQLSSVLASSAPAADATVAAMPLAEAISAYSDLLLVALPWQREVETLTHLAQINPLARAAGASDYLALALTTTATTTHHADSKTDAVLLAQVNGDDREARSMTLIGLASRGSSGADQLAHGLTLLSALVDRQPNMASARAVNIPPGDPIAGVLSALGCPVVMAQHEMVMTLR